MFKRKPSPEMEAIRALADEIKAADVERKSALDRLLKNLQDRAEANVSFAHARHWGGE